jgi:hypothetical protein
MRRALVLAGLGALGVAFAFSGVLEPLGGLVPRCPMHSITGLYCPGCGGTRALMRLLHFDPAGALQHNAAAVLAAPFLAWAFVVAPSRPWKRWEVAILIACIATFTVLRNLPWPPFIHLAPPR